MEMEFLQFNKMKFITLLLTVACWAQGFIMIMINQEPWMLSLVFLLWFFTAYYIAMLDYKLKGDWIN